MEKNSIEWLANRTGLPIELLTGAPTLLFNGKYQLWIENYKRIIEYQDGTLRLQTGQGRVSITGQGLSIDEFTHDGMRVSGRFTGVNFE